jgi:hypothetical protein
MRRLTLAFALVASMLVAGAAAATAQPRSIRVEAGAAAVRVAANDSSQVLLSPAVGTVFELTRTEGDWHTVLLPADAQGLRRYGYIRTREAVLVTAPTPPSAPSLAASAEAAARGTAPTATSVVTADWNQRMRAAEARKSGGRAKFWGGLGVMAGGLALAGAIVAKMGNKDPNGECSDRNPCYEYAWGTGGAVALLVTGGLLARSGRRESAAANEEIIRLKTELANTSARLVIPFGAVVPSPGGTVRPAVDGVQVHYRLAW